MEAWGTLGPHNEPSERQCGLPVIAASRSASRLRAVRTSPPLTCPSSHNTDTGLYSPLQTSNLQLPWNGTAPFQDDISALLWQGAAGISIK